LAESSEKKKLADKLQINGGQTIKKPSFYRLAL
jgi:hypothetical protein